MRLDGIAKAVKRKLASSFLPELIAKWLDGENIVVREEDIRISDGFGRETDQGKFGRPLANRDTETRSFVWAPGSDITSVLHMCKLDVSDIPTYLTLPYMLRPFFTPLRNA